MNTNNIYKSIIAFMLFLAPLEVLSQSDTVSNITNKHFDSNPSYEYATASTVLTQSDIVTQDILFAPKSPTVAGLAQAIDCPVSYYLYGNSGNKHSVIYYPFAWSGTPH